MAADTKTIWSIWGFLTAGAGLSGVGLFRDWKRFRRWRQIRARHDGEIVLGDRPLEAGQTVEIAPADSAQYRRTAFLESVEKQMLVLRLERPPAGHPVGPVPAQGERIQITVQTETALFRFDAPVKTLIVGAETRLTVRRPFWLARIQRRRTVRAPMEMPAVFEFVQPKNTLQRRCAWHGTVRNLSGGGLCAEIGGALGMREATDLLATLPAETMLRVRLPIPALSDALLVRLCLSERAAVPGGIGVRIACEFLPMDSWQQELLIQHIFQEQRHRAASRRTLKLVTGERD